MYIEITDDTFDISNRLKQLNENYFIRYNLIKKQFEVWLKDGLNSHLELVLDYPCLDFRTLKKVQTSKSDSIEKIIMEIDSNNQKLKEKAKQDLISELNFKVNHILH